MTEEEQRNIPEDVEERLETFKQQKAKAKTNFTRARHKLLALIDDDHPPRRSEVREECRKLDTALEKAMCVMENLSEEYSRVGDRYNRRKLGREIEQLENEFTEAQNRAQDYLDKTKPESSSKSSTDSVREGREEEIRIQSRLDSQAFPSLRQEENIPIEPRLDSEAFSSLQHEDKIRIHPRLDDRDLHHHNNWRQKPLIGEKSWEEDIKPHPRTPSPTPFDSTRTPATIGHDMWRQLKRVSIPVFSGNKKNYENWKAAFMACIDKAPATPEYKLLQLRQYLSGEALKTIESLGHSGYAYEAAKERLERKFGGKRRQIAINLEELETFKPIRPDNSEDIENFADLLDIAVINLKEAGRIEDLGDGSLYLKLQKKMTEPMLARYHRWVWENYKSESVETLREWVLQESQFQTIAHETIKGLTKPEGRPDNPNKLRTFFSEDITAEQKQQECPVCSNRHGILNCEEFNEMDVNRRWDLAKQLKLCFRCLSGGHQGNFCRRSRVCAVNGCRGSHHKLLHYLQRPPVGVQDKNLDRQPLTVNLTTVREQKKCSSTPSAVRSDSSARPTPALVTQVLTEGEPQNAAERSHTMMALKASDTPNFVALPTVPVILKSGNRRVEVNALLDDASTKAYLNSDVAAELGLQGNCQRVTVNVLNGRTETFETMPVEFEIESLDGSFIRKISAFTTDRVTGNLRKIDWGKESEKWKHLQGIQFPKQSTARPIVDILIGVDCLDLHFSHEDVQGLPGEPIARCTPLGWTCIGNPDGNQGRCVQTNFIHAYFVREELKLEEIDSTLRKFWEVEAVSKSEPVLGIEDRIAMEKVKKSLKFVDGRYQVGIRWKENSPFLKNNYEMAFRRLQNTEQRLFKKPDTARAYRDCIEQYISKG